MFSVWPKEEPNKQMLVLLTLKDPVLPPPNQSRAHLEQLVGVERGGPHWPTAEGTSLTSPPEYRPQQSPLGPAIRLGFASVGNRLSPFCQYLFIMQVPQ